MGSACSVNTTNHYGTKTMAHRKYTEDQLKSIAGHFGYVRYRGNVWVYNVWAENAIDPYHWKHMAPVYATDGEYWHPEPITTLDVTQYFEKYRHEFPKIEGVN